MGCKVLRLRPEIAVRTGKQEILGEEGIERGDVGRSRGDVARRRGDVSFWRGRSLRRDGFPCREFSQGGVYSLSIAAYTGTGEGSRGRLPGDGLRELAHVFNFRGREKARAAWEATRAWLDRHLAARSTGAAGAGHDQPTEGRADQPRHQGHEGPDPPGAQGINGGGRLEIVSSGRRGASDTDCDG